jgi:hypothetical protein
MYSYRFVASVLVFGLVIGALSTFDAVSTAAPSGPATQDAFQPIVILAALQETDGVRYSVAIAKPLGGEVRELQVEVTLPADARFVGAMETPGYTHFAGLQGNTLRWTTSEYPPDEYVDALTFRLAAVPAGDFTIRVSWTGGASGELEFSGRPMALAATSPSGELTLGPQGTAGSFVPAGDSGVLIGAAADTLPEGTTLRLRVLGAAANPPPTVAGDLWWCAMVELTGLPPDTAVLVFAPTRQPLPANAWLPVFALRGDTWTELPDQRGLVTFDGQYVALVHRGGVLATGANSRAQPTSADSSTAQPVRDPRFVNLGSQLQGGSQLQSGFNLGSQIQSSQLPSGNNLGGQFQSGFNIGNQFQGGQFQGGLNFQGGVGFNKGNGGGFGGMIGDPRSDDRESPVEANLQVQPRVGRTGPALRVPTVSGPLGVADMLRLTAP